MKSKDKICTKCNSKTALKLVKTKKDENYSVIEKCKCN